MPIVLVRNWWSLVLRGVVAIVLGIASFAWPGITVGALVILFGAYAFIDGVLALSGAWRASRAHERWGALILEGVAGILAAVITVLWPGITAFSLVYVIAAWALVTGVFEIIAAFRLRRHIAGEVLLVLGGLVSIVFGLFCFAVPFAGAIAIAFAIAVYLCVFGVLLIGLGMRLRNWHQRSLGTSVPIHAH